MKILVRNIFVLFILIGFASCQDVIELDLKEGKKRYVVDGLISNLKTQVRLTQTEPYFSNTTPKGVSGATMFITDDLGKKINLAESEKEKGLYVSNIKGDTNRVYQLTILTPDGKTFISEKELLRPMLPLDSLYSEYRENVPIVDEPKNGYIIWLKTVERQGLGDNYRWKFYQNGYLKNEPSDIFIADDQFVDGNDIEFDFDFYVLLKGDTARIEQMSITRPNFIFLQTVQQQTAFTGGIFDAPPAVIRGNVNNPTDKSDYPLGYFGASYIEVKEVIVK